MSINEAVAKVISGKKSNQTEHIKQCIESVEARYYNGDDLLPEYRKNPLISALGPVWDKRSILKALDVPIAFSEDERCRSEEYRLHAVGRLSRFVLALPAHLDVVSTIQLIVRQHYIGVNIGDEYVQGIKDRYLANQDGELAPIYPHERSHAYCAGVFGLSGSGKTTALESALRLLPKVIHHEDYGLNQVVWVKVDCPKDASLKGTLKLLILEFDRLLGTDYTAETGARATLADYANKLHRISKRHQTGLIVIDEMQNALQAVVRNDPLFDFFVNLTNVVKIPVIVSGTPKAAQLFRKTLRSARRISSQGVITWDGMRNEDDWRRFCNQLQKYQWLANPGPLSDELRQYLSFLTQWLPGVAVPLFQLAQYAAISSGAERLTKRLVGDVFDEKMVSLRPMMNAIRSGDKARMIAYDDLLGDTLNDIVESIEAEARRHGNQELAMEHDKNESAISAVSRLLLLGVPEDLASSLVNAVQKEYPRASSQDLSNEAARRFYQKKAPADSLKGAVGEPLVCE
ncbi:ATP-binding protein [Paraburkholderia metrosideri]|uniref:Transposon Tn7 transposition protein TnsC n=1 Tax=Paraburkholderia metrosideri TaxID=580937 RepID=A0ABN7HFW6_9BURK|nr:ATP-binding protein [Paraburkholderia metrosideri]CAD6516528.1 Transposon Tn7 transposition protein TnsC [Paraburkholderia metrosideri]